MFLEGNLYRKGKPHLDLDNPDRGSTTPLKGGEKKAPTSQELTLSYLCENPLRLAGTADKEQQLLPGRNLLGALGGSSRGVKGKEVASEKPIHEEGRGGGAHPKREATSGADGGEDRGKKPKVEALSLSLALPNLGLSLSSSNPLPSSGPAEGTAAAPAASPPATQEALITIPAKRTQSINTHNTRASSDDCAASRSYSYYSNYSNPFSHNPSCSLTRNSTENLEYSKENDHIWCAGEGTMVNISSINFSNHQGFHRLQNNGKEANNSAYRANSSDTCSFFPSELPAKQKETGRASSDGWRHAALPTVPDGILKEIALESVPAAIRVYLRNMIGAPEKRDEFASLQRKLERRSDLTQEILLKANRFQLEVLVAVKTGLSTFLSGKTRLPTSELVEIFLLLRCKNVNCRSVLPVEDCDCKICSSKKGFCSACMCPICLSFDSAQNTCSWVGCDICSHWCHAVCGIHKNVIRPGPCSGGEPGSTEMQFYCLGCGHASEMFGFVKDVFMSCAKDWGLETLSRELDCVRKIFRGSKDLRGKELNAKAEGMLIMLEKKLISPRTPATAWCSSSRGPSEFSTTARVSKDKATAPWIRREDANVHSLAPSATGSAYNAVNPGGAARDPAKDGLKKSETKVVESEPPKEGYDSLESIVRFKEAEADLFQRLADEARRGVERYLQTARAKSKELEEEYATKLAKLCLQETEERRRKKLEELKTLENSHYDYHNMKMRMQAEIAGLLERMEATKQQWV
ncbi:unnamed protein product [Spirodela intermedia]|uniref:Uncharacterized protein n=1 Tax=Spirodela intermedia TaxID=51605 RepID=A0A7I8J3B3_SPIIN|nr:unnamed protein product [Spirodela intermedia]CAA6664748.1 unnamed protein product [Spirodela intermedia]